VIRAYRVGTLHDLVIALYKRDELIVYCLFVWLWLVVYDRKFSVGIVFFSHTNQPAVLLHEPATIRTSQPNRLKKAACTVRPRRTCMSNKMFPPFPSHDFVRWIFSEQDLDICMNVDQSACIRRTCDARMRTKQNLSTRNLHYHYRTPSLCRVPEPEIHSAKVLPSAALGKGHSTKN